jgi:hypothetical protein
LWTNKENRTSHVGMGHFSCKIKHVWLLELHPSASCNWNCTFTWAVLILQAILYIRTLYSFTNETLAKYSYATSLQATLRYGILISLVQGLGLGFTYGLAICSCALQLWVGRFLISHGRANGGEIVVALFAIILSGL